MNDRHAKAVVLNSHSKWQLCLTKRRSASGGTRPDPVAPISNTNVRFKQKLPIS